MIETRIPMTRPYCLPRVGEPITPTAATDVVNAYDARVRRELERITAAVYEVMPTLPGGRANVHCWTPDGLVKDWCAECPVVRAGHICVEANIGLSQFNFVDVLIDKASGDLVIRDRTDLLASETVTK